MLSCEITEKELLAAAQYYNIQPSDMSLYVNPNSLVEYLDSGESGYDAALETLRLRGIFTIQKGRLESDVSFRNYIRSHKKPDLLVDYIHSDHEKTKTTSFLRKKASTYSLARKKDGEILVVEMGDQSIQEIIVEDQGEISSPDETAPLTLDYAELLALSAIMNLNEPGEEAATVQTTFNAQDISNWLKKGSRMGYIAGLLYFGENQKAKTALKTRKEILAVLSRLESKGVLRDLGGTYRLHDDILPLALTMTSPQKTSIISVVNKPFSRTPGIWECVLMKFGKLTVLMEFPDVSDIEITMTTIPNKKQLTEYLTTLIELEIPQIVSEEPRPKAVHEVPPPPPPLSQTRPQTPIRFCTNCGTRLNQDYKYCPECRSKVG